MCFVIPKFGANGVVLGDWVLSSPLCPAASLTRSCGWQIWVGPDRRSWRGRTGRRPRPGGTRCRGRGNARRAIARAPSGYSGAPMAQELSLLLLARLASPQRRPGAGNSAALAQCQSAAAPEGAVPARHRGGAGSLSLMAWPRAEAMRTPCLLASGNVRVRSTTTVSIMTSSAVPSGEPIKVYWQPG